MKPLGWTSPQNRIWTLVMHIRVEFYTGDHGMAMPQRIHFNGRQVDIAETLDRWYGSDYCYIKVRAHDRSVYVVRLDETRDEWELAMFQHQ